MTTVNSEVLETIKETYVFLRTTQGPKSFTYKLDRDFISQPGDDIILVDANNPTNIYEYKVGYDIKVSNFRQNEVYKTIKKTKMVEQTETPNVDCTSFNEYNFIDKIKKSLSFKFRDTFLANLWYRNTTEPSKYQKDRLKTALNILESIGYVSNQTKNDLFQDIRRKHAFLFDENGSWLQINKLTGNKSQFANIVSTIVKDNFNEPESKEIYCKILSGEDANQVLNKEFKKYLENKLELLGIDWLKKQTNLIEYFSKSGLYAENDYVKLLQSKNPDAVVLYQGGDGDLFDISLSIDLIIDFGKNSKYGIKTIQVKNSENAVQMMMSKYNKNNDLHKYIDWVVYPKKEGGWAFKDLKNG